MDSVRCLECLRDEEQEGFCSFETHSTSTCTFTRQAAHQWLQLHPLFDRATAPGGDGLDEGVGGVGVEVGGKHLGGVTTTDDGGMSGDIEVP